MKRSIHDNHLLGYSVDVERRSILVRTERRGGGSVERTDVRFEGVLGYLFRDSLGGILNDIYPCELEELIRDGSFAAVFEAWAAHAWPFQGCDEDPVEHVRNAGATTYCIDSAIGFDGFVVCRSMVLEAADSGARR